MATAGLTLAPLPALAQTAPTPASNTPATDSIGPRELSNFNLNGTVTRPAETPPAAASAPASSRRQPAAAASSAPSTAPQGRTADSRPTARPIVRPAQVAEAPAQQPTSVAPALALDAPANTAPTPASIPDPGFSSEPASTPATLAPEQKLLLWPWLLLALVIGAGGAALLWRRHSRAAYAGGPEIDEFVAPDPAPIPPRTASPPRAPEPAAAPAPPQAPKPVGIVSSKLRPWVDLGFAPIGCVVDDQQVVIEFEVQLTNTGSAPARDVLVEASMFNAGTTQDQDIGGFFARPKGDGDRIEVIAPLQQISIRHSLVAPRQNIQMFDVGEKQVFVPLVAFNVLYRAGTSGGQTSAAFMLGRETNADKLGPLRADLGSRAFTNLGTRPLEIAIRN